MIYIFFLFFVYFSTNHTFFTLYLKKETTLTFSYIPVVLFKIQI